MVFRQRLSEALSDICIRTLPLFLMPGRLRWLYVQRVRLQMGVLESCGCGCGETHIADTYLANPSAYRTHTRRDRFLPDVPSWIEESQRAAFHRRDVDRLNQS